MKITYFRRPIPGPESRLEAIIASSIHTAFDFHTHFTWIAASAPLGAGRPDLVVVSYKPEIFLLPRFNQPTTEILAYLFSIKKARLTTIRECIKRPDHVVVSQLRDLVDSEIVIENSGGYSLSENWRSILPEITAIEVKVSDWRRAIQQATRNRILSHRSYIALPERIANRAAADLSIGELGLGIMGIDKKEHVHVIKQAGETKPKIPSYYFKLATLLVAH